MSHPYIEYYCFTKAQTIQLLAGLLANWLSSLYIFPMMESFAGFLDTARVKYSRWGHLEILHFGDQQKGEAISNQRRF